jgi:hypothetical protein
MAKLLSSIILLLLTQAQETLAIETKSSSVCENKVTGFHLINPNLDSDDKNFKVPLPDIINLGGFKRGEINIEAETTRCPDSTDNIECVEISFSGRSRKERVAPYALYGDRDGHFFFSGTPHVKKSQLLKACMYTDHNCVRDEKCMEVTVDVVEGERDEVHNHLRGQSH